MIVTLLLSRVVVVLLRSSSRSCIVRRKRKGKNRVGVSSACEKEMRRTDAQKGSGRKRGRTDEDRRKEHRDTGRKEVRSHLRAPDGEERRER